MMVKNILNVTLVAIMLSACASPFYRSITGADNKPINLIPMYGHPKIEKTAGQKNADDRFIKTVSDNSGSREKASKEFAAEGGKYLQKGDSANAMRRFNQSWLLDPANYLAYWGFGALLLAQDKAAEAASHFDKALSLIDDDRQKPRLLVDSAKAYANQGGALIKTDKVKSEELFGKANSLIEEALKLDPQYGNAYRFGALIYYYQGNYEKAWEIVKRSRALDAYDFRPNFIEALSKEMKKPK